MFVEINYKVYEKYFKRAMALKDRKKLNFYKKKGVLNKYFTKIELTKNIKDKILKGEI